MPKQNNINYMTNNNLVSLNWVPGHSNIPSNDEAGRARVLRKGTTRKYMQKGIYTILILKKTINNKENKEV